MKGSKLLETLDLLSKDELESLDNFLQSPYFYSDQIPKEIYPLFQYIMSYFANRDHPNLQKENVFKFLYPKEKLIKGRIDKLMSALLKQIHHFIKIHFSKDSKNLIKNEITLVHFFRQRNANKFVVHYLEKIRKKHDKEILESEDHFYNGFLINKEMIQIHLAQSLDFKSIDFEKTNQPLDVYYILNKLQYACFLLSIDRFRQPIDIAQLIQFIDELKPICLAQGLLNTPILAIHYQTYEMLKKVGKMDTDYWELKELIEENEKIIPLETAITLSGLIRNFMLRQLNHGEIHLVEEIFQLYQSHLKKGYLNYENGLLPSTIKNIVSMGIRSKEFNWIFQFLKKYKNKIRGTQFPEDVYHYNLAYYYFGLKKYDQALELLADKYDDLFYKISAKRIELKIYYETKSNILPSKIDAFKIYIFRLPKKSILDHKRATNNNYINFLRQLNNPQTALDPKRISRLETKINASKLITEKEWLLEKLTELKK